MEKVFINRNEWAESRFYTKHANALSIANVWIIPLMQKFGVAVNFNSINDYLGANTRDLFIDEIIRSRVKGVLWPAEMKRHQAEAENTFDKALLEVIESGDRIKNHKAEYDKARQDYEDKKRELAEQRENAFAQARKDEITREISSISEYVARLDINEAESRREIIEDEKRAFQQAAEEAHNLEPIRDYIKFEGGKIEFDEQKVIAKFAVYADNKKEVKLYEKVKQLAALINEVYGGQFGVPTAFYHFFSVRDGRVIISPEIKKEILEKYAKNM
ncbi:MAG: hypothetical protein IJ196_03800 [Prevotella sp.]|nr:hypothetical protein [Prevotella sp.]